MENKSLSNVWKMKSAPNNDVNADDIFVNVEFNSSYFTVEDGRFYTTRIYDNEGVKKVLEFFGCIAYVSCPVGEIAIHFEPIVDAETFTCYGVGDMDYSNNFFRMVEVKHSTNDNVIRCKNDYNIFHDFPLDVVEYLFLNSVEEDEEGVYQKYWTLKKEIVKKIEETMKGKDIKSYVKSNRYEELCDVEVWMDTMSNNGTIPPLDNIVYISKWLENR